MTFVKTLRSSPPSARIGLGMVALCVFAALLAPWIAPYQETQIVGDVWAPKSAETLLGTDQLGRDMLTRLIYGARNTIAIAFVTTALSFIIGVAAGFLAATVGGWIEMMLSRIVDILMAFPTLIFALIVLSVVGTSISSLILVIAILDSTRVLGSAGPWPWISRSWSSWRRRGFGGRRSGG